MEVSGTEATLENVQDFGSLYLGLIAAKSGPTVCNLTEATVPKTLETSNSLCAHITFDTGSNCEGNQLNCLMPSKQGEGAVFRQQAVVPICDRKHKG